MSDPVVTWNTTTINGIPMLVISMASLMLPLDFDPSGNMFLAVGVPSGGYGNLPFLLRGQPGDTPTFDTTINLDLLDPTDPTADSGSLTPLGGNVWQANFTFHKPAQGIPGTSLLDPDAYGTPISGKTLIVNPTNDGFIYQATTVGDRFGPASILSCPAGNPTYTLCSVALPACNFDWRPRVSGQTIIQGTGANVHPSLVARLNNSTNGNIVGMGWGPIGLNAASISTVLSAGPPAASNTNYDRVTAGSTAVVYLNVERLSGTDTMTTTNTTTWFTVWQDPIPNTGVTG